MKLFISIVISGLLITSNLFSQRVFRFGQNAAFGITNAQLDGAYLAAINKDSTISIVKDKKKFLDAYETMLAEFQSYLRNNNFIWEKNTTAYHRVYFSKKGKIDYFIFSFAPYQLTDGKQHEYGNLLVAFLKKYKFPIKAKKPFEYSAPYKYKVL